MLLNEASLKSIQRYCVHNRALLDESSAARCVHCGASFAPTDIAEYTAVEHEQTRDTARCPKCGDRSVLPSAAPIMLDARTLEALQRYWFSGKR
ncbi:MAG: hypothetical protein KF709_00250 [Gemmatimonadaceae bacterium]|nr:hypothetical protein [Gemmatimonadaceae bacterium]